MIDEPAPITEHLGELRRRIFWILITMVVFSGAAWAYTEEIFLFLMDPAVQALGERGARLQAISPTETFFTYLKCALLAGFVCSLPVIFWQIWAFVAPGLYDSERRAVIPFVLVSTILFVGGAMFGYTRVFPIVFSFLSGFSSDLVEQAWTMREAFSVTTRLFLAFGIAFELPVVVFFLAITGILTPRQLFRATPYAVLVIFVVAAILTPPDAVSQVMLAAPMLVLYLAGVGVAFLVAPGRKPADDQSTQDE